MHNFEYYAPTKVVFGRNTESETGKPPGTARRYSSIMEAEALCAPGF